jgi:hypothetical protein
MFKIELNPGTVSLVIVNLFPLLGALMFDWSLSETIALYWLENVIVGFYNVLKMKRATAVPVDAADLKLNGQPYTASMKGSLIKFFILHYGLFTFIHGVFVLTMFGAPQLLTVSLIVAFCSIFVSHGISFKTNFIDKGEFERISAPDLMFLPYKRIVILHFVVLLGGILAQVFGTPVIAVVLLILLKIVVDLLSHSAEHMRLKAISI